MPQVAPATLRIKVEPVKRGFLYALIGSSTRARGDCMPTTVPVDAVRWFRPAEEADMGFPRFLFTLALAALTATAVSAQPATRNLTVGQTVIGHLLPDEREIISPNRRATRSAFPGRSRLGGEVTAHGSGAPRRRAVSDEAVEREQGLQTLTVVGCQAARRGDEIDGAMASRNRKYSARTPSIRTEHSRGEGPDEEDVRGGGRRRVGVHDCRGLALCASGQDGEIEGYFEMVGEELLGVAPRLDLRRTGESRTGEKAREEFDLQAGRRYFIFGACDADCSDIRLRLLGPEGASVDEDIRRGSRKAQVYFAPETSGVFAVEVSMVECAAASCGWAVQAYAHGTPFSDAARRHDGALAAGDDRYPTGEFFDTYALDASAGEILIADLRSESFNPYLAVEAPSGAVLTDGDYRRNRSGVEVAVTRTGRWTVRVTAFEPGGTGRYRLTLEARAPVGRIRFAPPVESSRVETGRGAGEVTVVQPWPWNSYWYWRSLQVPEARALLVPPTEGSLARGDRRLKDGRYADTHVFRGAAGDRVTIELGTADGFDAELMLLAPNGELVVEDDDDDQGFWHARIQVELESTGEYRVVVASSARRRTGSYVLRVTADPEATW